MQAYAKNSKCLLEKFNKIYKYYIQELHAHLNGSLSENTLRQLGCLNEEVQEYNSLTKILQKTERTLDECFNLFKVAHQVTGNIENLYLATLNVIKEFHEDGVLYLELRTTPRSENNMTKRQYIETVIKAIRNNKCDIVVKLILSIDRRHVDEISYESLNLIIKMKQIHPDVIVGVDLCGNPNEGKFDCKLFQEARENNLKITLHCAEVKNDLETIEILNFKPDRIGHGTCIHPDFKGAKELWDNYLKTKIPIEMCLTSNVICGTSNSYKEHHIKNWYEKSLPLAICVSITM